MLTLYDYYRSSACFRVRIALNLKKVKYEAIPIHLAQSEQYSEAFQNVNPQSLVPCIQDGDQLITQSLAIIEYLDETYPDPAFLPKALHEKALVRAFALSIVADIHPLNNLRVLNYLTDDLKVTPEQKNHWYHHWIHKGFAALETRLTSLNMHGDFCFGNQLTVADICLVPQMFNARRFDVDLTPYPILCHIDDNCQKISAVTKAWPLEKVS